MWAAFGLAVQKGTHCLGNIVVQVAVGALQDFLDTGVVTPEFEEWIADPDNLSGITPFLDALTEAIVEHVVGQGEVTVMLAGADGGAGLPQAVRLNERELGSVPTTPDAGLQQEVAVPGTPPGYAPTIPGLTSVTLSIKGLID